MRNSDDHFIELRDGRTLCFAQYGDPEGFVVVNAHGGLACRRDVATADAAARAAGVRLISPDRPGVGRSDPRPGRTLLDWVDDVSQLLDRLGVARCAAMGWSMGGQYAAAVGAALRPRVTRVAIIAGALPLTEVGVFEQLPGMPRVLTRLSQRMPVIARLFFAAMGLTARAFPELYGRLGARDMGPADAEVLCEDGLAAFGAMSAEALRQPRGVAEEYRAWARPWGFAPEDVTIPVDVWFGADDGMVDHRWPAELARRFPAATLSVRPGGHLVARRCYPEIFQRLRS